MTTPPEVVSNPEENAAPCTPEAIKPSEAKAPEAEAKEESARSSTTARKATTRARRAAAARSNVKAKAPCTPAVAQKTSQGGQKFAVLTGDALGAPPRASRAARQTAEPPRKLAVASEHVAAIKEKLMGAEAEAPLQVPSDHVDLHAPEYYLNRELTWLNFNSRVLHEAQDSRNPLLERVKFLAIASSNLDEFFMKRIGGLKQQVAAGVHQLSVDGRTPTQQIHECAETVKEMQLNMRRVYLDLVKGLERKGIFIADYEQLTEAEQEEVREVYLANILPLVTPLAMDPAHPFPFISNLSLNLLVTLRYRDEEEPMMNRIKVPLGSGVPRFLGINGGQSASCRWKR